MYEDVNKANGGFLAQYGTWFMSIGLSGQKWKWHFQVLPIKYSDGIVEYLELGQSTGSRKVIHCIKFGN